MTEIPKDGRIYVAGHRGLVGPAVARRLEEKGATNILAAKSAVGLIVGALLGIGFPLMRDASLKAA